MIELSKDNSWEVCVVCGKTVADEHGHIYDLMTGQEWYDRFEKEIEGLERNRVTDGHLYSTTDEMFAAARRAAGL
jgi:hypothetical protein